MKKVTKGLIIAACAASVIGVGAVSFAAWQNNNTSVSVSGATGVINLVGFKNTNAIDLTDKKLIPYDQGYTIPASGAGSDLTYMYTVELPDVNATGDFFITIESGETLDGTFYALMTKTNNATAPTTSELLTSGGWKAIAGTATTDFQYSVTLGTGEASKDITGLKLFIILDSSKISDMNQGVSFTVTASSVSALSHVDITPAS